ncbi:MAG: hypothetical protein COB46_09030 [Rhodospirillaceae bacterium]|nr:MAG: hypothetical protein COB46_09030 [Rhodospirillaceae bacterium]
MSKRNTIFLILSIALALTDGVFVYINNQFSKTTLQESLHQEGLQLRSSFDTLLDQTYSNMLVMATFIANNPDIQDLFLKGKKAVEAEGGGAGGGQAALAREALYEKIGPNWKEVQKSYDTRQLHFHLGPGSTSFLRVHRPEKYGDNMDNVRFTVVDTNKERTPRTGFETGRVYSGLRGVVPVTAWDKDLGKSVHVGALEVGTSFSRILKILDRRYDLGVGVSLTKEHINSTMWPDFVNSRFGQIDDGCDCIIEATTRDGFREIVQVTDHNVHNAKGTQTRMMTVNGAYFAVSHFHLRDYKGTKDLTRDAVGSVIFWRNADARMAAFNASQTFNIMYGILGFVLIELLLFFTFRYALRHLEAEVAQRTDELAQLAKKEAALAEKLQYEVDVKNRFFSIIAHDLRSPFNVLLGMTEMMATMAEQFSKEKLIEYAGTVNLTSKRVFELLQNLLDWSRLQRDGIVLELALLSLDQVAQETVDVLKASALGKDIDLSSSIGQCTAFADRNMVLTIMRNLVGNALKFTPSGGSILVSAVQSDDEVQITIMDTGVGLSADLIEKIFALDQKTSTLGTAGEEGTGLGLPLCKEMVEKNGGKIWVESTPGEGSKFHFTLPLHHSPK